MEKAAHGSTRRAASVASLWPLSALLLCGSLLEACSPPVPAQSGSNDAGCAGRWVDAGAMNDPRRWVGVTTTVLSSGEVLVTGGLPGVVLKPDGGQPDDLMYSAELYSPLTDTWHATSGPMAEGRIGAAAVRLLDGRVLVSGSVGQAWGMDGLGPQASVEIYDPARDAWSPAASMHVRRYEHTATLLKDGRVLVTGGWGECARDCHALASTELYDPATDTWTLGPPLPQPEYRHAAVRLQDGRVLVTGMGVPQLFDPQRGTWQSTPLMPHPRFQHFMLLLPSGRVLVMGGDEQDAEYQPRMTPDVFDPVTERWTSLPPLARPRFGPAATQLADGRILLAGGWTPPGQHAEAWTDVFDEATGRWQPGPDLRFARQDLALAALADGTALAIGGSARPEDHPELQYVGAPVERFVPGACE